MEWTDEQRAKIAEWDAYNEAKEKQRELAAAAYKAIPTTPKKSKNKRARREARGW